VAIVLFMLDTGVCACELCGLAFEDLSYDWSFARVMGKGRKQRYVPISPKAIRPMQRYVLV
jgi:site-specific recombinase XerD